MVASTKNKMNLEDMSFPLFRKYANDKNFFKIFSPTDFEEVYFIGSTIFRRNFSAVTYTDRMEIQDLIFNDEIRVIAIPESEYPN
jgi:hypothetical protein